MFGIIVNKQESLYQYSSHQAYNVKKKKNDLKLHKMLNKTILTSSDALTSAPCSIKYSTISGWFLTEAQNNGVRPAVSPFNY